MEKQIHGSLMNPCFVTEADFEEGYRNSTFYVESNYLDEYRKHLAALEHIANIAKSYILNNWQNISNWKDLEVTVIHGPTGVTTEYYNYVPHVPGQKGSSKTWDSIMERLDENNKKRHNPILEVNSIVLDPTDGDFSITVNGDQEHWWIQDEAVIIIADYIEKQLNSK